MTITNTYFPNLSNHSKEEAMIDYLFQIEPLFDCPDEINAGFSLYLQSLKLLIQRCLPKKILDFAKSINSVDDKEAISEFYQMIINDNPTISWSENVGEQPFIISIGTICQAGYTHGVGRFLCDIYSRWLVPGKQLTLVHVHSVAFRFSAFPEHGFYIHEIFIKVENRKDLALVYSHLPNLVRDIKLNILAVQHARRVISLKPLTLDQKKIIIQENIASLIDRPSKEVDHNIFDQMHHFLLKVSAEEKVTRIKEQISPLIEYRPQVFERDIFHELQNLVFQFKDSFTASRDLRHLRRIISYSYLLKKIVKSSALSHPHQRHVSFKLMHAKIPLNQKDERVVGCLVVLNILRENEIVGEKHLLKAIQSIIPEAKLIQESIITNKGQSNSLRSIYLEIYKGTGKTFSKLDIQNLRSRLSREIKTRIESVINPIFMPRNEEEVMRNILALSNQLKYLHDIPQVIISFHKQTDQNLTFTVILLRILKPEDSPLHKLFGKFSSQVKFSDHEVKKVGFIRKKYPKEANVFEMHLQKKAFLRKDFSVDLYEARRFIYKTLSEMIGEVRDYNGGMISKQVEVLNELKKLLLQINIRNDFLLENFFYSISPNYMQSILKPHILKKLFLLVLEAIEHDYSSQMYFLKTQIVEEYFLLTISGINPSLKEFIDPKIEQLEIQPSSLASSYVNIYDIGIVSFMLRFNDPEEHQKFLEEVISAIRLWKDAMEKTVSPPSTETTSPNQ